MTGDPAPERWLLVDVGTTATKAALTDAAGAVLARASRDSPTRTADGGIVEQDARDWWRAFVEVCAELPVADADAVALTGQMQDLLLFDATGAPLRPVILYSDARAQAEAEAVETALGAARLVEWTGNAQGASGLLAKLRWLLEREPGALERAEGLLPGAADWLAFRLTGRAATDTTTASTTGLMALEDRAWLAPELFDAAGLTGLDRLLPELVPGGARVGRVTADAARETGLRRGIPVHLGPGDAVATALGVGSGAPGAPYGYLGTSGWVAFAATERGDPERGVFTLAHPDPALLLCVAPLLTAGGNLDWIRGIVSEAEIGPMVEAALARTPSGIVYLPYLRGERSPFSDPHARGAFVGLGAEHDRIDLVRAVLEGVAFAYRHALETLAGHGVTSLRLSGGGTRSPALCRLLADVTGLPVTVSDDAVDAGLRGALLAARGELASTPPEGTTYPPDPERHTRYDRVFEIYLATYPALRTIFADLALS